MRSRASNTPEDPPSDELLREIRQRCLSARTRTLSEFPESPHDWKPDEVRHPETGERFNTPTAWAFIAECYVPGAPVRAMRLRKPPDRKAFELVVPGYDGVDIYMKVEMGPKKAIARSFHASVLKRNGRK